jgi:MFS superfamily sulfate permease-like transporter
MFRIALASGAPLMSELFQELLEESVGFLSKSHISVSGPAAGLTAIILTAITDLGALTSLTAVLSLGLIQLVFRFYQSR